MQGELAIGLQAQAIGGFPDGAFDDVADADVPFAFAAEADADGLLERIMRTGQDLQGTLEVLILHNRRRNEDEQIGFLPRLGIGAKEITKDRDIAQNGDLGIAVADVILHQTAQDQRVAARDHDPGLNFTDVVFVSFIETGAGTG